MSAGRLTVAEYDERLAQAYASRTYGGRAELTADRAGPGRPGGRRSSRSPGAGRATPAEGRRTDTWNSAGADP